MAEGSTATNTGTFADADGDPVNLSASYGTIKDAGSGTWAWQATPDDGPGDGRTVTITATTPDDGRTGTATFALTVKNVAPTVTSLTPSATSVLTGTPVTFTGQATDPSSADTGAGFGWSFNSGSYGSSNVYTTQFTGCGQQTITARAQDKDGGVSAPFSPDVVTAYDGSYLPPLVAGVFNKVQSGRVVPVKISVGCGGATLSGLSPAIQLLSGDVDPNTDPGDGTVDVATNSVSGADTTGLMRAADGQYIYNLQIPKASSGTKYTVRVRPFGAAAGGALYVALQVK